MTYFAGQTSAPIELATNGFMISATDLILPFFITHCTLVSPAPAMGPDHRRALANRRGPPAAPETTTPSLEPRGTPDPPCPAAW
jgi:hypothetical protein